MCHIRPKQAMETLSFLQWRVSAQRGTQGLVFLLPNNQRQHRTLHIQKDVLPYALR